MRNSKELEAQHPLVAAIYPLSIYIIPCLILYALSKYRFSVYSLPQFPPGPPTRRIFGNILSFNPRGGWIRLTQYKYQFGDLVFFHGLGNTILALNSMDAIHELLEKRPNIYSHRPVFTVVSELMGLGQSMPLMPYGKEWRESRKLAYVALSPVATRKYQSLQEDISALLNKALLDDPENFFALVRLTAGRIILSVTYGLSVNDTDDKYITHAEETMEIIGKATVPGAFLCDFFPALKHLPSWIPFQRKAAYGKAMIEHLVTMPFEHVKRHLSEGTALPSLTQDLLLQEKGPDPAKFEHRVKWTSGAMYGAGGETTYATVLTFMMAMALNPDKQRLAQTEIDLVIGSERLPEISDRPNLRYVGALIKETMRWHPALPLSIARLSAEDDVYGGYFIPKGTIVVPNVWAIAFQPDEKYDPELFIPERFLDLEHHTADPLTWAFGFGRRVCPGRALAENSLFALISGILAVFDILLPVDGKLEPNFGLDLVSYPQPFKCRIMPRSAKVAEIARQRASQCVD